MPRKRQIPLCNGKTDFDREIETIISDASSSKRCKSDTLSNISLETIFDGCVSDDSVHSEPFNFKEDCSEGLVDDLKTIQPDNETETFSNNDNDVIQTCDKPKVWYFHFNKNLIVIIPQYLQTSFEGFMLITVLHGEIDVLGYTLNKLSGSHELFSPRGASNLYIKNTGTHVMAPEDRIFSDCPLIQESSQLRSLVTKINPTDSVILCQEIKNFQVDFVTNHVAQHIYPMGEFINCTFNQTEEEDHSIKVNSNWDDLIKNVNKHSKILLAGGKSVGKSTLLRYMVNKLLSRYKQVLLVDLDPGQPEFTVAGCISTSIITEPLFGPNFTHLRKPTKCIFISDIDLSEDVDEYIDCVEHLLSKCTKMPLMPTIINHMGITRGFGFYILSCVVAYVQPTVIINIKSSRSPRNYNEELSSTVMHKTANMFKTRVKTRFPTPKVVDVSSMVEINTRWHLEPRIIREMCVLSYFGSMMTKADMAITDLEKCTYKINLSSIKLRNKEGPTPLCSVNGTLIALCCQESNHKFFNCIGWAIIRAINFETQDLYVMTPVTQDELERVDTFILGSVALPPSLLMTSCKGDGPIPYVSQGIIRNLGALTKRSHIPRSLKSVAVKDEPSSTKQCKKKQKLDNQVGITLPLQGLFCIRYTFRITFIFSICFIFS